MLEQMNVADARARTALRQVLARHESATGR